MTKSHTKNSAASRRTASRGKRKPEGPTIPGGKLGVILQHLQAKAGATIDDLAEATGLQKHTVHAALSRLRGRGFAMAIEAEGAHNRYRLSPA